MVDVLYHPSERSQSCVLYEHEHPAEQDPEYEYTFPTHLSAQSPETSHSAPHIPRTQYELVDGALHETAFDVHEQSPVLQVLDAESETVVESLTLSESYSTSLSPEQ